jgi:hypothetical protein
VINADPFDREEARPVALIVETAVFNELHAADRVMS